MSAVEGSSPAARDAVPTSPEQNTRRTERLLLVAVVLAVLFQVGPLFRLPYATDAIVGSDSYRSHDWQEVAKLELYARRSLLEWKRFPLWNPLLAGGTPQFAHPSDGSSSPLILSSLVFGETLGMKVNIGIVALLGALGVFFLGLRVLRLTSLAAAVGAVAYAWAGWLPARVAVGFYESCLMAAWPAILALWLIPGTSAERRKRWVFGALLLWALAIQLQLAVPVFVLLMLLLWLGMRGGRATGLGGLAILGGAGALGAVKFLPMLHLLQHGSFREARLYPTHPDAWYRNFDHLWYALFHHVPSVPVLDADGGPRVQEYMTLQPGLGALLLAAVGTAVILRQPKTHAAMPWLLATAVFIWLSFGPWAPVDGFKPLSYLPLFESMRGPLRYFNYPIILGICLLAAVGFQQVSSRLEARGPRAVGAAAALSLLLCLPAAVDSRDLYRTSFLYSADPLPTPEPWRSEGLRGRSSGVSQTLNLRKYSNIRRNVPTIYVPEDIPIDVAAIPAFWVEADGAMTPEPLYRGEAWVGEVGAGTAWVVEWRAQELIIGHSLSRPGRVHINQNHWEGWTCGERPALDAGGRIAFDAPAGEDLVTTCTWRAPGIRSGLVTSMLGLLGLIVLWPHGRGQAGRRRTSEL